MIAMPLREFIKIEFGTQVEFAKWYGTTPQQVSRWVVADCLYIDNKIYRLACG
jgi:hypothetical protein